MQNGIKRLNDAMEEQREEMYRQKEAWEKEKLENECKMEALRKEMEKEMEKRIMALTKDVAKELTRVDNTVEGDGA